MPPRAAQRVSSLPRAKKVVSRHAKPAVAAAPKPAAKLSPKATDEKAAAEASKIKKPTPKKTTRGQAAAAEEPQIKKKPSKAMARAQEPAVAALKAKKQTPKAVSPVDEESASEGDNTVDEESASEADDTFQLLDWLHLGLNLKIGKKYSATHLRTCCRGDARKLALLEKKIKDRRILRRVEAESSTKRKAATPRSSTEKLREAKKAIVPEPEVVSEPAAKKAKGARSDSVTVRQKPAAAERAPRETRVESDRGSTAKKKSQPDPFEKMADPDVKSKRWRLAVAEAKQQLGLKTKVLADREPELYRRAFIIYSGEY